MKPKETVLVSVAHPDDEAIGPGGTIAKYAKEGKRVIVILFTDGESSHPWKKKHFIVKTRKSEIEKSGKLLGVSHIERLSLPDGMLLKEINNPKHKNKLVSLLEKYKPTKVFTHAHDDMLFPDHLAVHTVTVQAVDYYTKIHNTHIDVYTFNIWAINIRKRYRPQLYVDISQTYELKKQAIHEFKSQNVALTLLWPTIIAKAFLAGLHLGVRYAEKFYKIR